MAWSGFFSSFLLHSVPPEQKSRGCAVCPRATGQLPCLGALRRRKTTGLSTPRADFATSPFFCAQDDRVEGWRKVEGLKSLRMSSRSERDCLELSHYPARARSTRLRDYNQSVEFALRDFRHEEFEALWRIDQQCFAPGISYSRTGTGHISPAAGRICPGGGFIRDRYNQRIFE